MKILVLNCGSTSIKYQLYEELNSVIEGRIGKIGEKGSFIEHGDMEGKKRTKISSHREGLREMLDYLTDKEHGVIDEVEEISAVGHRVVHGGEISESCLITEEVKNKIKEFVPVAPLHNPVNLKGIEAMEEILPEVPQVAVFDTSFHQTMPKEAYLYGLPLEYYKKYNIRRYGFHGTSHKYVAQRAAEMLDEPFENLSIITCHLGGGCSMAAVKGGKSIDTTMGFTPLEGIIMTSRCGDIDPTIVQYLKENTDMGLDEIFRVLNKESGLKGLSGISRDVREILEAKEEGDERADLALRTFAYKIKKYIGAYTAVMGSVDAIVFTAGIGVHVPSIRGWACDIDCLNIELDSKKNQEAYGNEAIINKKNSDVKVLVIPTDEEGMIAQDTKEVVEGN